MLHLLHRCVVAAIVCLAFATAAEAACAPSGKVVFEDQFDELAPSWGNFSNYRVEDGNFVIQPPAGFNTSSLNTASLYDDVTVCVEMTVPPPVKKGNCGGIVFWAEDFDNYYTFQVSTDGLASVWRRQRGKWLIQVSAERFAAIKKSANQVNELSVQLEGNRATFLINGKAFKGWTGQAPKGGSEIGLIACAPNKGSAPVYFDNLVISEPGKGAVVADSGDEGADDSVTEACTAAGKTLFEDQFDQLSPFWGTSDNYEVDGGKLVIHPPAGFNTATINSASLYDDVDICAEMTASTLTQGNCGGVIFWAADYDNYYSLQVGTSGQASVWRRQKGKWLSQIAWQDFSAIHKKANQVNTLRVVTTGNKAKIYVNGRVFGQLTGQPPQGGSQIGLMACSPDDTSARVELDNFIVSAPGGA